MCVACGQFTGSSRCKTEYVGPTLYKKEKFLNWRGTMTLGSIYDPHITYGPWSYTRGDIGVRGQWEAVWRAPVGEPRHQLLTALELIISLPDTLRKGKSETNHAVHKSSTWMSSSAITNAFACHVHYKNKTIYGLFKVPFIKFIFLIGQKDPFYPWQEVSRIGWWLYIDKWPTKTTKTETKSHNLRFLNKYKSHF